ncbi:MAG: NAD(+) synthase [Limnochordia bacterium]|nr:NAD(+) synthase [Limnochordia bacterium]
MRDYHLELEARVRWIRECLESAGAQGIVLGLSGGKDSALVGALSKLACEDTVGLILPCRSRRSYGQDLEDAQAVACAFGLETRVVDLQPALDQLEAAARTATSPTQAALVNMAPRLRMAVLYAVAASENRLVAGTGNRSEIYLGYFTKWGDGACDFNPIADLTATEVVEFLRFLGAPASVVEKAPSAGLYDGQTDEGELGIAYREVDAFLTGGQVSAEERAIIARLHGASEHKRRLPRMYGDQR